MPTVAHPQGWATVIPFQGNNQGEAGVSRKRLASTRLPDSRVRGNQPRPHPKVASRVARWHHGLLDARTFCTFFSPACNVTRTAVMSSCFRTSGSNEPFGSESSRAESRYSPGGRSRKVNVPSAFAGTKRSLREGAVR